MGAKDPSQKELPRGTGRPSMTKVFFEENGAVNRTYQRENGYNFGIFQLPGLPGQQTFDEEASVRESYRKIGSPQALKIAQDPLRVKSRQDDGMGER